MSQDGNQHFRFDLNETLWFQRGQEVSELLGIALEPDISIYDKDDFVSVRGVLELTGEYIPAGSTDEEPEQDLSIQDRYVGRYIQDIRSFEDGVNEFHYDIPVEITIPRERVQSLDEVAVQIDFFDYELKSDQALRLTAEVIIDGIDHELREEKEDQGDAPIEWESEDESFSFDFHLEQHTVEESLDLHEESSSKFDDTSEERNDEENIEEIRSEMEHEKSVEEIQDEHEEVDDVSSDEYQKGRDFWFKKKTQSFEEFFGHEKESSDSESPEEFIEAEESSTTFESSDADLEESGMTESYVEREDAGYLTTMFRQEEESYTKIKLRIVQQNDTLESLAELYHVSPSQIQAINRLEDENLTPGQLLYIPVKTQTT